MDIYVNKIISEVPIVKIKKLLIKGRGEFIYLDTVYDVIGIREKKAKNLLKKLEEEGYLEKIEMLGGWINTIKGNILANSSLKRVIKRADADRLVLEAIQRMEQVNQNDYYLYYVTEAYVVGEYLNNEISELSSIYIAVETEHKERDPDKFGELTSNRAHESNKQFNNSTQYFFHAFYECLEFVKSRKHNLFIVENGVRSMRLFNKRTMKLIYTYSEIGPKFRI